MEERSDRPQRLRPPCFQPQVVRADPTLWCTSPTRLEHLSATPPVPGPNTTPLHLRLDRQVKRLAHPVVGGAFERHACAHQPLQRVSQSRTCRVHNRQVVQPGRPCRWSGPALALPRIQPDVVMVTPSRDKRRRVPESLHQLKPQNPAVKSQRPLKVSYLQVDMPHPDTSIDRRIVHTDSMTSASIAHYWPAKKSAFLKIN